MNNEVKLFIHDGSLYMQPYHILLSDVEEDLKNWKKECKRFLEMKKEKPDHFIFCTKLYDINDCTTLLEIHYYMQGLSDKEFHKRVEALHQTEYAKGRTPWIGAWHKGTNW